MCGIVGAVRLDGPPVDPATVGRAAMGLRRRGPDDHGVWHDSHAALGHRRLAILDLTPTGHQPMVSADGRYVVVYNGEIYNFRELRQQLAGDFSEWRGNSDTEVLLAAYAQWGTECLARLRGMFAFAIWDTRERCLFMARDRMGVKPLYYRVARNGLYFASRPRALRILDPTISSDIDVQGLRWYLESGFFPAPHSLYRDIRKVEAGHFALFDSSGFRSRRYWDFRSIQPERAWLRRTEDDLLDELQAIVTDSVRHRMVSDVPIGTFLSGGVDSTLVTATLARLSGNKVQAFTIGFDEPEFDESAEARAVARHLGVPHATARLRVDDLLELRPMFREEFDEPFFDSSAFPVMAVSRLAGEQVKVVLSGDGGDELFGGYHYYRITQRLMPLFAGSNGLRRGLAGGLSLLGSHRFKLLAGALRQPDIVSSFAFSRSIAKDFASPLVPEALGGTVDLAQRYRTLAEESMAQLGPLDQVMRLDMLNTLQDDYLQKVDVGSMAFSIEAREPLLDQVLVEWAMKLPVEWKLHGGGSKYLLKKLAYRYVPAALLDRPKRGFGVPIAQWLRGPLRPWAESAIGQDVVYRELPLERTAVRRLFEIHQAGRRDVHPLLWAILVLIDAVAPVDVR